MYGASIIRNRPTKHIWKFNCVDLGWEAEYYNQRVWATSIADKKENRCR